MSSEVRLEKNRLKVRTHAGHCGVTLALILIVLTGCFEQLYFPEQSQFAPLAELAGSDDAMVRVYAGFLSGTEGLAAHLWFVIKPAGPAPQERWEVWYVAAEPYGFVRKNLYGPDEDIGTAGVFVVDEITGPQAEPVVEFIRTQSPVYPCRDFYLLFPGPNSSTYFHWVLDQTGWDVETPPLAIGIETPPCS